MKQGNTKGHLKKFCKLYNIIYFILTEKNLHCAGDIPIKNVELKYIDMKVYLSEMHELFMMIVSQTPKI